MPLQFRNFSSWLICLAIWASSSLSLSCCVAVQAQDSSPTAQQSTAVSTAAPAPAPAPAPAQDVIPQPDKTSTSVAADQQPVQVTFGLAGTWKLGQLCPVRVQLDAELQSAATAIEVQTVDGDGVDVTYRQTISPDGSTVGAFAAQRSAGSGTVWMSIRIGRQNAPVEVRVWGADQNQPLFRQTYVDQELGQGLLSSQPLIVAIGSSMGIESLSRSSADGSQATFSVVRLQSADEVPPDQAAYSSCDLLLISSGEPELLHSLDAQRWSAIDNWIRRGGACLLSLGDQLPALDSLPQLASLLPGKWIGTGRIRNPAALESLVGTEDPLSDFGCALIDPQRGRIELTLSDSLSRSVPWWISYSHGLGTMRFVASDLGEATFEDWDDRGLLWSRLIAPYMGRVLTADGTDNQVVGEASYLGYSDIVGQLRATLDLFPGVRVVSFGQIAALLVGVLLLIGPIDYLVSVKWLKRPELSWTLAGLTLVAICIGLTLLLAKIRPSEVHINSAQIIDIDVAPSQRFSPSVQQSSTPQSDSTSHQGIAYGQLWSHVFSGAARELDMAVAVANADSAANVDWQGLPGHGLGGLLSQMNTDRGMPGYTIDSTTDGQTTLNGVGIPTAGTKCLTAQWMQPITLTATSRLREIPGVDQLQGELANPLPVDVLDPVLYYHNWFYSLNSRIPAGGSVNISFDTIPKDISLRLNGRRTVDSKESTTRWDPADRSSIDRLLELMMFYKAANGKSYTLLTHRFQPLLDQSNLLQTDRAILLGRLDVPWASVQVALSGSETNHSETGASSRGGEPPLEVQQDMDRVWCRIAIPVQPAPKK